MKQRQDDNPGHQPEVRTRSGWLGVYLRGFAMGVAELVPGVSGGTIAFITGIFDELVGTLAGLRPPSIGLLRQKGALGSIAPYWQQHNLTFLLCLGIGMLSSVALLAHLLSLLIEAVRPLVWGFFFGLILYSVYEIGRHLSQRALLRSAPIGLLLGLLMALLEPLPAEPALWMFFFGGALAVSAWLLPAVSGSFLLLVLGLYESVLAAVTSLNWSVLLVFGVGCATGLLLFANLLSWLLKRYRESIIALLTGFMAGAAVQLWPWQVAGDAVSPGMYQASQAGDALVFAVCTAMLAGALVIAGISRITRIEPSA